MLIKTLVLQQGRTLPRQSDVLGCRRAPCWVRDGRILGSGDGHQKAGHRVLRLPSQTPPKVLPGMYHSQHALRAHPLHRLVKAFVQSALRRGRPRSGHYCNFFLFVFPMVKWSVIWSQLSTHQNHWVEIIQSAQNHKKAQDKRFWQNHMKRQASDGYWGY